MASFLTHGETIMTRMALAPCSDGWMIHSLSTPGAIARLVWGSTFIVGLLYRYFIRRDQSSVSDFLLPLLLVLLRTSMESWRHVAVVLCGTFCLALHFWPVSVGTVGVQKRRTVFSTRLKPKLFPSRTSHARLFPKKHSFSYSYLLVGVPVGWNDDIGSILSAGCAPKMSRKGWFHVDAADHLARDVTPTPSGYVPVEKPPEPKDLKTKLMEYLQSQGVHDSEWKDAYLITAPSFLGYCFNPVSFWYIYDRDDGLTMMILEVNNTFDERRMYLLRNEHPGAKTGHEDASMTFTQSWEKDFHVSPFNSRKGSYSLQAHDPFTEADVPVVKNIITLTSSKSHPKLVARIFSTSPARDPQAMSRPEALGFILHNGWIGFLTSPRIIYEAARLFFRQGLHVWYRPEVEPSSIGRQATPSEQVIEGFFADFLEDMVRGVGKPIRVIYHAACNRDAPLTVSSTSEDMAETRHLEIRVLSPAFYSRLVHYRRFAEALDRECIFALEKNRTLWVSDPKLLGHFAEPLADTLRSCSSLGDRSSWTSRARWQILQASRGVPPPPAVSDPSIAPVDPDYWKHDIRPSCLSELDWFVRLGHRNRDTYWRAVMIAFLANRFTFGLESLVVIGDWCFRLGMFLVAVRAADGWNGTGGVLGLVSIALLVAGVHFWALFKGH